VAIDFPKRNESMEARKDLNFDDYVTEAEEQINVSKADKIVVVAHSAGGVVALKVAENLHKERRLAGFIAVSAAIPKNGGSFISCLPFPQSLLMGVIIRLVGTKAPESAIRIGLCSDLSAEQADEVVRRFAAESTRLYTTRVGVVSPNVPKLYIKLTQDKEFDASLQATFASNLGSPSSTELNTGHMPMLKDPAKLAELINGFIARL
jgi:pimeloyl-ACP methyl ester carboxylesterase